MQSMHSDYRREDTPAPIPTPKPVDGNAAQPGANPPAGRPPDRTTQHHYARALTVLKGAVLASGVVFVTIVLALQAVARFS